MEKKLSRRKFLVRGGLGTIGVLAVGTYVFRNPLRRTLFGVMDSLVAPYSGTGTEPNLWFEVGANNKITLYSPKMEMGQGTFTGLAQMAADELDVNMEQIQIVAAPTISGVVDGLSTGGSLSIAQLWEPLREMAATMREMLKIEAGKKMGVAVSELSTKAGVVSGGAKSMTYAEIAKGVTDWEVPDTPELKAMGDYQFIGKPIPRVDLEAKVFGDPIFGMDAEMPEMLYAAVVRSPYVGASFKSADTAAAEKMPGVVKIVEMEDWVGVVATTFAQAEAAKMVLKVQWDVPQQWTEEKIREMIQVGKGNEMIIQKEGSALEVEDEEVVSLTFTSPIGAHAQIEPNGVVAHVDGDSATIILSTQVVGITQKQVAEALDLKTENINVIPTYLGGGFGRRLNTDHAVRAAKMSKLVEKPVKYFFSRKEEFQHDMFRPPTHHIMKGKLNEDGLLEGLEHHFASGNVAVGSVLVPSVLHSVLGADMGAIRGGRLQYSGIANIRAVQWHNSLPFATSWWRSLGLLANTFAIESFMDEMALKSGKDPAEFRLEQIDSSEEGERLKAVIKAAVEKSGYWDKAVNGRAMGLAVSTDAGTPCAQVVELSIEGKNIKVHKVTCVMDCGIAVNPDQVKAQCEGAIIMGISASMFEKMTVEEGQLYPTIYGPYDMALMKHAPKDIEVHLIQGVDRPLPVGEPPLGPIGAAIGNAVRRLKNVRLTELPLHLS
ncbi:xanthine dehydrogenase family protein molybdopterin-binding subunit [Spongiimicrobium salis]|uniref:xanthine dehydrogenase family protein molybdopterin-binding subunit n=1 Tax=Spongiimicrobium salis TaxID=1667022 RepID=UPI00374DA9CD